MLLTLSLTGWYRTIWRDVGDELRQYDAFGRPADKWADRPSRLYAICHEFSGAREMPMTFEEAEEEQEREPWEDVDERHLIAPLRGSSGSFFKGRETAWLRRDIFCYSCTRTS